MHFYIFVLLIGFTAFLFTLFMLSHDDFVFIRKNLSMERVFNFAFLAALVALFSSRLLYVIDNPSPAFSSILGFIVFPYYPGLSVIGGVLGGLLSTLVIYRGKDMPIGRILDFFAFSFLTAAPIGLIGMLILLKGRIDYMYFGIQIIGYIIFLIFSYFFFLKRQIKAVNDGKFCSLFLIFFSVIYMIIKFVHLKSAALNTPDFWLLVVLFIISLGFSIKLSFNIKLPKLR